jgi:Strictosidine synthase
MDGAQLLLGQATVIFDRLLDRIRGKAVTIPPLDGAFRPNAALDDCEVVAAAIAPDNLCSDGDRIFYTSENQLRCLDDGNVVSRYDAPITALAASPAGDLAIALDDGRIIVAGCQMVIHDALCPTALAFAPDGALFVAQGSSRHRPSDWVVDLLEKNAEGSLWRIDPGTGDAACIARGLAFPAGLAFDGDAVIATESWRHRLIRVRPHMVPEPVLAMLPGYPGRLAPAADGGFWLTLFAPRNRLIEFILAEDTFRTAMMSEVPRTHWIAPTLSSGESFLEPLQCGGVRTMGIHKPWSPSRSYGLLARLDTHLRPIASYHSRAGRRRHGVTSVVPTETGALVTSKGGDVILKIRS